MRQRESGTTEVRSCRTRRHNITFSSRTSPWRNTLPNSLPLYHLPHCHLNHLLPFHFLWRERTPSSQSLFDQLVQVPPLQLGNDNETAVMTLRSRHA